jgi:hypothetical protein
LKKKGKRKKKKRRGFRNPTIPAGDLRRLSV